MKTTLALVGIAAVVTTIAHAADNPTFDAVSAGRKCRDENQQLVCEYRVGKSLRFVVVGIGQPDTGITFYKSDWDGDYYATYGLLHGCVIVKPGPRTATTTLPSFAFVSPKNGKVYLSWETCQRGF
jgi:hypothetical protein